MPRKTVAIDQWSNVGVLTENTVQIASFTTNLMTDYENFILGEGNKINNYSNTIIFNEDNLDSLQPAITINSQKLNSQSFQFSSS
jgi:hypothetical protein